MQPSVARLESDGTTEHGQVRYAKPSEWAAHKDLIRRLYLDENKTLDEVRRIMADENQFHATPSMYKKRIRAWHLSKKLEEEDVLEVLQQKLERKAAGESSHNLVIRGRVVRNQRLRRFLERRPDVLARLQAHPGSVASIGSPSSSYGVPTEVPRVRSLSPESRNMEQTLSAVRDYVRSPLWIPSDAYRSVEILDLRASRIEMLQAVDEFYWLQASIDNNKPPKVVFQLVNSTLNRLSGAIRSELPDFFFQMLEVLQHPWSNHVELSQIFRRHVAELAVVHLGRNHPMSILWIHLLRENDDSSNRIFQDVLELLLQELLRSKGPQDHLTCVALDYLLRFLIHTQGAFPSWKRFRRWLDAYPGWDNAAQWSNYVQSTLEDSNVDASNVSTVMPNRQAGGVRRLTSAAIEYQRPGGPSFGDLHSAYLLPYLAGRISIRNGDAERAEGLFLKAKAVAKQARQPHLTDYYIKAYTNLHVLYVATKQGEKLAALHEEIATFKADLGLDVRWPTENLPHQCSGCV
ncbi:Clr5 domain-containing protein [Ustulina deusta]|nr:Clr5 domain-containing protein [Ustulina deusta]KAI3335492.1 Clr5 domain-containing protein [Ustulina deusta]